MRAVVVRKFGGPERVEILEVGVPVPGPEEVLVRVHAAPVMPVDLDTRSGELAELLGAGGYCPLGREAAGTVTEVGALVSEFETGDEVIGWCDNLLGQYAAQADYVLFSAACCAHAPTGVSLLEASTLPLNGLTADRDRLRKLTLLAELGDIKMRVGSTYPLEDAAKSHERFAQGRLGGHLVLLP